MEQVQRQVESRASEGLIRRWSQGDQPPDAERITDRKLPERMNRDVVVYFDTRRLRDRL